MDKLIANLSIVSVLFLLIACSSPTEPVNPEVDIIGTITKINSNSEQLEILVEENPDVSGPEKKNGKKIWFLISNKTEIYKQGDFKLTKIKSEYLQVGMEVQGRASKFVLLSYPAQAGAVQIVVIEN